MFPDTQARSSRPLKNSCHGFRVTSSNVVGVHFQARSLSTQKGAHAFKEIIGEHEALNHRELHLQILEAGTTGAPTHVSSVTLRLVGER